MKKFKSKTLTLMRTLLLTFTAFKDYAGLSR